MFQKILILRLSAIGDTIHTLPLINALKKRYPDCQIDWVVEDKAELFVKNHENVDRCFVVPKSQWKKRGFSVLNIKEFFDIVKQINKENYDIVIDTQQLAKSAIFLPFLNIKRKITLSGGREFSGIFSNEIVKAEKKLFDPNYHVVKRNLEFASYLGARSNRVEFSLKSSTKNITSKVLELMDGLDKERKTVVISPATTWENKHWDENCWIDIIDWLKDKVNLVFTGTAGDIDLINRISANVSNPLILAGKTSLEELAEVFRHSDIVISPDSGSAHIAWAVEKPYVITIFTATAAKRNAPFGDKCYCFYPDLPCYPCMKRKCRLSENKNLCKKSVSSENVLDLLKTILHFH